MPRALVAAAMAGAMLATQAPAQPRTAPDAPQVEKAQTPPADVWLRRLPGRYVFDGVIHHEELVDFDPWYDVVDPESSIEGTIMRFNEWSQPIQGKGDCIEFAEGPSLQCVVNLEWPELWRPTGKAQLGGAPDLTPGMLLAGITPGTVEVRFLLVNFRGFGYPGKLVLRGNTAGTELPCVNMPGVQSCDRRFTISTKTGSEIIFVQLSTEVRFLRSKLDRKRDLERIGERTEKSWEWLKEILRVSLSMKPAPPDAPAAASGPVAGP